MWQMFSQPFFLDAVPLLFVSDSTGKEMLDPGLKAQVEGLTKSSAEQTRLWEDAGFKARVV